MAAAHGWALGDGIRVLLGGKVVMSLSLTRGPQHMGSAAHDELRAALTELGFVRKRFSVCDPWVIVSERRVRAAAIAAGNANAWLSATRRR